MSASTIPIGFPSSNGHAPPRAISKPAIPVSTRQRPRWAIAAIAATLVLLFGGLGAFLTSRGDERGPVVPAVVQAPESTASPWSQYRNGPGHAGVTADLGPEESPGTLWTFATGNKINSEAAIVDGVAYIGSGDGNLYALDAVTGAEKWRFDAGAAVDCGPAVANGTVYFTTRHDELIAVSTENGSELWRFAKANSNASAVLDEERLYMQGNDGNVYALDPATGAELWSFATGLTTGRTAAYADGLVLAGTEEGTLFAVDAASGSEKWSFVSKGGLMVTTVVADGVVYQAIADGDGNGLYALDLISGNEHWTYHALDNASIGVPTAGGDTVYFTSDDGRLYALDASNGVERWLVTQLAPWQADGKVAGDYFYIYHSGEQKLFAFEKTTGTVHWEVDGVDFVAKGPSIAGGVLYASTVDGVVHAIAANTGDDLGTPAAVAPAAPAVTLLWSTTGDESSRLVRPEGIGFAPDGTIWVTNSGSDVFEIYSPDGTFLRTWGTSGSGPGQFRLHDNTGGVLGDIDWDADGNMYVFDSYNGRVQKFDPAGNFLLTWGTEGTGPGQMDQPLGVVDAVNGRVYVTGTTQRVDVYDLEGNQIDQFGGFGGDPGKFIDPFGIALDDEGNVYVADKGNARIQVFDRFGNLLTDRGDGGVLATGVGEVYYLDIDASGRIYAADYLHGKLLVFDPDGNLLLELDQIEGLPGLGLVTGVAVDAEGNVWLTNEGHHYLAKVQVALPAE